MRDAVPRYRAAFRDTFETPLSSMTIDELRWYFHERQRPGEASAMRLDPRFDTARRAFASEQFRTLYEAWRRVGERALDVVDSPLLSDAVARGSGRLDTYVLPHAYLHLLPLVGTA